MYYLVDLDNTLLDTFFFDENGNVNFYWSQNFKEDFGFSPQILSDLFKTDFLAAMRQTKSVEKYVDIWIQKYGLNISASDFLEYWLSRDSIVNAAVLNWLKQKKKEGHMFYVASNQPYIRMDYLWNKFPEWHSIFSDIFISSDLKVAKPSPDFFRLCQQRIQTPFEQICLIDDSIENIQTAQSLGMQTVLFKTVDDLPII